MSPRLIHGVPFSVVHAGCSVSSKYDALEQVVCHEAVPRSASVATSFAESSASPSSTQDTLILGAVAFSCAISIILGMLFRVCAFGNAWWIWRESVPLKRLPRDSLDFCRRCSTNASGQMTFRLHMTSQEHGETDEFPTLLRTSTLPSGLRPMASARRRKMSRFWRGTTCVVIKAARSQLVKNRNIEKTINRTPGQRGQSVPRTLKQALPMSIHHAATITRM
mmetsp:Transcript_27629/g.72817  ORF Transcript_27629/g.72817 Transcript_27629/m.72817 type:complete len:222 (+) Transcript_27629:251-916(+)